MSGVLVEEATEIPFDAVPPDLTYATIWVEFVADRVETDIAIAGFLYGLKEARPLPPAGVNDGSHWYQLVATQRSTDAIAAFGMAIWRSESGFWMFTPAGAFARDVTVSVWFA